MSNKHDEKDDCGIGTIAAVQRVISQLQIATLDHVVNARSNGDRAAIGSVLALLVRVHELVQTGRGTDTADAVIQARRALDSISPRPNQDAHPDAHCCWPYKHRGGDCVWDPTVLAEDA